MTIRFLERKAEIRAALIEAAKRKELRLTYEQFGERVGIWRMRGAKDVLDLIAQEARSKNQPDVTYILCNATYGYPSQIGGDPAKPPSDAQKRLAHLEMQGVINRYCRGAANPYQAG